jgi:hypothetical protein
MTEIDNFSPIIRTKLYRPSVPLDFLRRPRLQEALDTFRLSPLTLVSAAAGYGKSTLVSDWLNELDCQSAWVTLDESDNDLRQFLGYLVAAVQTVFPSALKEIDSLHRRRSDGSRALHSKAAEDPRIPVSGKCDRLVWLYSGFNSPAAGRAGRSNSALGGGERAQILPLHQRCRRHLGCSDTCLPSQRSVRAGWYHPWVSRSIRHPPGWFLSKSGWLLRSASRTHARTIGSSGGFIFPFLELGAPMTDLLKRLLVKGTSNADFIKHILTGLRHFCGLKKPQTYTH